MKRESKLLILVLSVALILAAAVICVGAADDKQTGGAMVDGTEYPTFEDAFDSIYDKGGKITLLGDAVIDFQYRVVSDIEIDLAGYTMTISDGHFAIEKESVFTITGSGTINVGGAFLRSTVTEANTTEINVIGKGAPIYIYYDGTSQKHMVSVGSANCNFENVELRCENVASGQAVFSSSDSSAGTTTFRRVNLVGKNNLGQNSTIIKLYGNTVYKIYDSSFISNTSVIYVSTKSDIQLVEAENSKFINRATTGTDKANETGVIGVYSNFNGKMYFKNSLIEGGYRPILLKGSDTSLIHLDGSVLKYTGAKSSAIIRTCNMKFTGGSSIVAGKTMGTLSDTSGYISNVDLEVGTRVSLYFYNLANSGNAPELRVMRTVINSYGESIVYDEFNAGNGNYEFIYDPQSDPDVPYVLVDKYERDDNGNIKLDAEGNKIPNGYVKTKTGNILHYSTGASLPEGTIWQDQKYKFQFDTSSEFPNKTYLTWNKAGGSLVGYTYGGNNALKYVSGSSTAQCCISLVNEGRKYNASPVMVFEIDFATDSALGFANGTISVNVRTSKDKSGGSNQAGLRIENNGVASPYAMSVPEGKEGATYTLDRDSWHKLTIIFYTDTTLPDESTTAPMGKAYYYLDGELLGDTVAYKAEAATVYGIRFDTNSTTEQDSSILFDNVTVRTFDSYLTEGESLDNTNPSAYLLGGGLAAASPLGPMSVYSVAGERYDTLDEAIEAAKVVGSYVSLLEDITTPTKITTPCTIYANGYTIKLAEGSIGAEVSINPDGSNYTYKFNPLFSDLKVTYEWFVGDVNSVDELKDPSKYISTTVSLGELPKYVGSEFILDEDYFIGSDDIYDFSHIGWSREIGAETPDVFVPLTISDAINHKNASIKLFPVFGYEKRGSGYTWAITDADGKLLYNVSTDADGETVYSIRAGKQTGTQYGSFWTNTVKLGTGETFNLFADLSVASDIRLSAAADKTKPYNFNLNGHTLSVDGYKQNYGYGNRIEGVFGVSENCTLNVYSAYEGAEITSIGYNKIKTAFSSTPDPETIDHSQNDYSLTGGVLFRLNANNATINVGTVTVGEEEYSGKNISVKGDCLAWIVGGENAAINVDGIDYVRTTSKYNAVAMTRDTNGTVTIKNSTVILAAGGTFVGNQPDGDDDSASIIVKDSIIIMQNNGDNAVFRNKGQNSILIENCVTNATLNADENSVSGEGTVAYSSTFTASSGSYNAKATIPMTLDCITDEKIVTVYAYNTGCEYGDFSTEEFRIVGAGSKDLAELKLPTLTVKTLGEEDVVKFTFAGFGDNADQVFYYNPGTTPDPAPEIAPYKLSYVELIHNGKFDKRMPEVATESIVFTPLYTMKSTITGLKTSVTLYTDFVFNLYIPAQYKEGITEIVYGGKVLSYTEAEIDGVSYMKLSIPMLPKDATEDLDFAFKITDSGYTGNTVVTTSVADYADEVMKDTEKYTLTEKKLVYAMLSYANEASLYHSGKTSERFTALLESNVSLAEDEKILPPSLDGVAYADERFIAASDNDVLREVFVSAKVRLSYAPMYVFLLRRDFVGTVTVRCGYESREFKIEKPSDRTIILDGMNAADFAKTLYISVSGEIDGKSVEFNGAKYNLATYLKYHIDNIAEEGSTVTESQYNSENAVPLIKALLSYVAAADDYRESILVTPDESIDSSDEYVPEGDTPLGDVEIDG